MHNYFKDFSIYICEHNLGTITALIKAILFLHNLQIMHPILLKWDKMQIMDKVIIIYSYNLAIASFSVFFIVFFFFFFFFIYENFALLQGQHK